MTFWLGMIRSCLAAVALASFGAGSHAVIVSSGSNNPLGFSWSYNTGLSLLTGSGSMTVGGFNSSLLSITVSLTNTSSLAGNNLIAFGFGINSDATSIGFADSDASGIVGASLSDGTNLGNGVSVEVCVWAAGSCQGDTSTGGIFAGGGTDTFSILLGSTIWGNSVEIDPLGFKYHTGTGPYAFTSTMSGSSSSGGGSSGGGSSGGGSSGSVPEPGTGSLALLSLALLGAGFALRRERQRTRPAVWEPRPRLKAPARGLSLLAPRLLSRRAGVIACCEGQLPRLAVVRPPAARRLVRGVRGACATALEGIVVSDALGVDL
ncbi:MAG: cistern family PEP-CTERM protein [Burkholderiales bacterium]|nr:cistern family PEP-CTERM protein [Burkholderiales bacterium]